MDIIVSFLRRIFLKLSLPTSLSNEYKILLLVLSIAGAILVILSTSLYGAAVSPDSIYYISAARNLAEGNGLISFAGTPLIEWPPLYPFILAIPDILFNIDPLISAPVINAIFFGLTIYFAGLLFSRYLTSSAIFSLFGVALILLSNILQDLSTKVWSENLFILLVTVFLFYLEKYMSKKSWTSLIILSVSAGLAYLTRYIGVCLIATGALVLFFHKWGKLRSRFFAALIFTLISALPVAIIIMRNYSINGTLMGSHTPADLTLFQNLGLIFNTILDWGYFPPKGIFGKLSFFIILLILAGSFAGFMTKTNFDSLRNRLKNVFPIAVFIIIYLSFLLYSTTSFVLDPISMRFVSPIYIPLTLLFLILIDILLDPAREKISPVFVNTVLVAGLMIWIICSPLKRTSKMTLYWMKEGTGGFTSNEWRNCELIKYMQNQTIRSGQKVYTNEDEILYILTEIKCEPGLISITPGSNKFQADTTKAGSPMNNDSYDYFVWFSQYPDSYPYSIDEIENSPNLRKIIQASDGAVFSYHITPKPHVSNPQILLLRGTNSKGGLNTLLLATYI